MKPDLIERLKDYRRPAGGNTNLGQMLDEAITALSAPLPDEVENVINAPGIHYHRTCADDDCPIGALIHLTERLALMKPTMFKEHDQETLDMAITALSEPLPEDVQKQLEMLRKQCMWQRAKGTDRDNGYPYHKHLPDCDICRSADLIERLAREHRDSEVQAEYHADHADRLMQRIEELDAALAEIENSQPHLVGVTHLTEIARKARMKRK